MREYSVSQSLWMIAAGLSFALMTQCIKFSMTTMGVFELGLYRALGGIVVLAALMAVHRQAPTWRHPAAHFWRAAWGTAAILMFYYAIAGLPAATAYALNYTAPLLFIVLVGVVLREQIHPATPVAVAVSFGGVLLLLRPDFTEAQLQAGLFALVSGLCAALAFLMIRKLGRLGESGLRTVFFFNVHASVFAAVGLLLFDKFAGLNAANILPVLGVIVFATTGQLALTRALHRGSSSAAAALSYSGVVFTVILDVVLHGIEFAHTDYLGFVLIVASGAWALWLARAKTKRSLDLDVPV